VIDAELFDVRPHLGCTWTIVLTVYLEPRVLDGLLRVLSP
jgi:hypothetical protein